MKLHLRTFGCRSNRYDSEIVRALALDAGYEVVEDVAAADVAVFNSCAVTGEAERDLRKAVRRAAAKNPSLRSVIMGCASALPTSETTLRSLPSVEHLVPGADVDAVARALDIPRERIQAPAARRQTAVRALLRVQDGCDEHCTFCATTIARGANRSRSAADLLSEAAILAEHHPEIVITGTHIGSYGRDIASSLGALLELLIARVPRARFRLSSVEATEVDDRLYELFVSEPARVVPHLHAPLQSGSDRLLKRMGRHWYTAESYAGAVERLAARLPVFGLGADVIAGFPGEGEVDFRATVALIERLPFTYLHVFTYSARPGTAGTRLTGPVPPNVAQERSAELRRLAAAKAAEYRERRAHTPADVVVVSGGPEGEGLTEDYLTVRLADGKFRRGDRFQAVLRPKGGSLVAV